MANRPNQGSSRHFNPAAQQMNGMPPNNIGQQPQMLVPNHQQMAPGPNNNMRQRPNNFQGKPQSNGGYGHQQSMP